ncbi:hypothetical protein SCB29_33590 [Paraburkholderia sp. SIMBA_055]
MKENITNGRARFLNPTEFVDQSGRPAEVDVLIDTVACSESTIYPIKTEHLQNAFPDWKPSGRQTVRGVKSLMRAIEEVLEINAFDEANAEMLGSLPTHKRPPDRTSATDWICAEYRRKGETTRLLLAQMDGKRCGEAALEVLRCIEDARAGKPYERMGTTVARWYRESVVKERTERPIP